MLPIVTQDEEGVTTLEWWAGDRKITMYPQGGVLIKAWGKNIATEMEDVMIQDTIAVREAFKWLVR